MSKIFRRLLSMIIGLFTIICMPIIIVGYVLFGLLMGVYYIGVGVHKKAYEKVIGKKD